MSDFISGMICMGCVIVGVFFLRYWRQTSDRLFLFFALAFWVYAVQRVAVEFSTAAAEDQFWQYLFRLAAFVLILFAIADKNRRPPARRNVGNK